MNKNHHDYLPDFHIEENGKYAEVICEGFTENQIEHLEFFATHFFKYVDNGEAVDVEPIRLVLDSLEEWD